MTAGVGHDMSDAVNLIEQEKAVKVLSRREAFKAVLSIQLFTALCDGPCSPENRHKLGFLKDISDTLTAAPPVSQNG